MMSFSAVAVNATWLSQACTVKTSTSTEDGDSILKLLWGVFCPEILTEDKITFSFIYNFLECVIGTVTTSHIAGSKLSSSIELAYRGIHKFT